MSGPLNSSRPTTAQIAGAVYNASTPAPVDQQAMALQVDDEGNLLVNVAVGGGGGSVTSKIEDSDGNPLLSNGAGALQVDVVNFPATQPVSGTVTANQGTASAGAKWSVEVDNASAIPVSGTVTADIVGHAGATLDGTAGSPSTGVLTVQGVSGGQTIPVTASIAAAQTLATVTTVGTVTNPVTVAQATAANLNATVVGTGTFAVQASQATAANLKAEAILLDAGGTNLGTVKAASTAAATTDTSLVVQINPEQPNLTTALNVQVVSGSTTAVTQATAANLNATVVPGASAIFEVSPTTAANTNANPFFNSITDGTTKATVIAATAALKTDLSSVAGTATVAASAGIQKVGISGNAGASVDAILGAAIPLNAILIGGSDGTDLRALATDTSGRQEVVGAAGSGSAVVGNPVLVGGSDGTDARTLLTDNTGQLKVLVENGSAIATTDLANGPVIAGTAASKSELIGGVAATAAPTATAGQQIALQMDGAGNIRVNPYGNTGSFSTQTASGTGSTILAFTVPAGKKWIFKSAQIAYTASSSASRQIGFYVQDNASHSIFGNSCGVAQTTATQTFYSIAPGLPTSAAFLNNQALIPAPEMCLGPGYTINMNTAGVLSGDAWTFAINVIQLDD